MMSIGMQIEKVQDSLVLAGAGRDILDVRM